MGPKPRRSGRGKGKERGSAANVDDVYYDMLVEAAASSPSQFDDDGRSIKRRRMRSSAVDQPESPRENSVKHRKRDHYASTDGHSSANVDAQQQSSIKEEQTVLTDSEESEEEIDWEDVQPLQDEDYDSPSENDGTLELTVSGAGKSSRSPTVAKRKPMSSETRKLRTQVHKAHLLCLLAHVRIRNRWCNDDMVQVSGSIT